MSAPGERLSLRKKVVLGAALGLTALAMLVQTIVPPAASATTGAGQSDPAWDFGRGGVADNGIPCYLPAPNVTQRKEYNLYRPACYGVGHLQ